MDSNHFGGFLTRVREFGSWFLNDFSIAAGIILATAAVYALTFEFGSEGLLSGVTNGITTATVIILALFSYRYSVKSNVRSAVGEFDPMVIGTYRIKPTVYAIKWRPKHLPFVQGHTAIKYKIYRDDDGERYLLDTPAFFEETGLEPEALSEVEKLYSDDWLQTLEKSSKGEEFLQHPTQLSSEYSNPININASGLHATYDTTSGYDIKTLVDHTMRRLRDELRDHTVSDN